MPGSLGKYKYRIVTSRKDMGYPVKYIILSNIILGYNMDRRDSKFISFERYEIKFKRGYPMG